MRTIRTTMEPHREYEVTDQEFTDLSRQGLILDPEPDQETGTGDPDNLPDNPSAPALPKRTSKREQSQ